jgi:hypothetical protein
VAWKAEDRSAVHIRRFQMSQCPFPRFKQHE